MSTLDDAKARAAATYDAAADAYDDPANSFWGRFGRRTVERISLKPGSHVLDVCCGSGASAIPAAEAVGPAGSVLGIDLAGGLLALARGKAERQGLANVEFRQSDLLASGLPSDHFDAVVCVFGIFFVPDMAGAVRELWRLTKPGGRLALTTWGPNFFEPVSTDFWSAVRDVRPELYKGFNPWDRISTPEAVTSLLKDGGAGQIETAAEEGRHPIPSADAWWSAVLGSGYRGTIEQMSAADREHIRRSNAGFIAERQIRSVEANVVYAVASKPR